MKSLYHSYYRFYKPNQKPEKILAISDVHFAGQISADMRRAANFAIKQAPSLIVISGDLVDNLDMINTDKERAVLKKWLSDLAALAPVCLCLGNHDYYRKGPNFKSAINRKGYGYIAVEPTALKELVADVENVHLLDNEFYMDAHHCVYGLTLPANYYDCELHPGVEDINELNSVLAKVADSFKKLPRHKTKIILIHSPAFLTEKSVRKYLEGFDFIIAGHMHNGIVPPLLHEIWRGHRGIALPTKEFFKDHNTRLGLYDDQLICLGAVTTVQKNAKPLGWTNNFYPTYVASIEVGRNSADARKPDVKNKYER
jgi:predicted MPP superfamily phosphohydrolase